MQTSEFAALLPIAGELALNFGALALTFLLTGLGIVGVAGVLVRS